ncbi:hypothetical protein Tco_1533802 [Tanacetum coccineum]
MLQDGSEEDLEESDDDDETEDTRREEALSLADTVLLLPVDEPFRPQTSISLPLEAEVERLLAMTTPSPSPPISLSSPSAGERLVRSMAPHAHSSPLHVPSSLLPSSGCPTQVQTLKIAFTQALIKAVIAALPSPPLPPLPPSLYIPPPIECKDDIPESEQPPRKRLYLSTLGSRYKVGESSTARPTRGRGIDYGFVSTGQLWMVERGICFPRGFRPHSLGFESDDSLELQTHRESCVSCTPIKPSQEQPDTAPKPTAGYSHSDTTSGTDGRDSSVSLEYMRREMSEMQSELLSTCSVHYTAKQQRRARQPDQRA